MSDENGRSMGDRWRWDGKGERGGKKREETLPTSEHSLLESKNLLQKPGSLLPEQKKGRVGTFLWDTLRTPRWSPRMMDTSPSLSIPFTWE